MTDLSDFQVVTEKSKARLSERELLDYREEREDCLRWLLTFGKKPDQVVGYAKTTVDTRASRLDIFYRFVWDQEGQYTINLTHDHADAWMTHLAHRDVSSTHKCNCVKALKMLYKWLHHQRGHDEWEPEFSFSQDDSSQPRDYLTLEERRKVRTAALQYGSVPAYSGLTPEERERWKAYLAQRLEKPMSEVTPDDWDEVNGWKFPSLVWTCLDTGLRPIEVERSKPGWVDTENNVLRIPKEDSSKNRDNWVVGIRERTAKALDRWLEQRATLEDYDGRDELWLTRKNNPYDKYALRHVMDRLTDLADIDTENRQLSWYAIRHSVGTYMAREEGLAAAQAQLRHKCTETTMKYDQAPVEDRRDALERMG